MQNARADPDNGLVHHDSTLSRLSERYSKHVVRWPCCVILTNFMMLTALAALVVVGFQGELAPLGFSLTDPNDPQMKRLYALSFVSL